MSGVPDGAALAAARIVDAVADAAERWTDADLPARVRATRAIVQRTGYTEPVVDFALDALFGGLTRDALRATITGELGSLAALDGFVARAGRPDVHFRGVERVAIVSSDTTVGVAIPALVYALCAKADTVVVKDRNDGLVAAFAETIAEERPELGARTRIERWEGHDAPQARAALQTSDVVVAFGGATALRAIRDLLHPEARFVPFGHRTSVAYVTREALDRAARDSAYAREIAFGIARDALLYDGEGCLSLHAVFVERDGALDPVRFDGLLGDALEAVAVEFPASSAEPAAPGAAFAREARFRAAQGRGSVRGGLTAPHLLVAGAPLDDPPPLLPRTLASYTVDGPADVANYLRAHAVPVEAFAVASVDGTIERPDVLALALACGAVRLCAAGAAQLPSLSGEHGGTPRILPFVRAIVRDRDSR